MLKTDVSAVEFELLHTVTGLAVSRLDLKDVLSRALPSVLKGTGAQAAECWIFDPVTQLLELKVHEGERTEAFFFERTQLKLGEGLPGIAAQTLQPVFSSDLSTDPRFVRKRLVEAGFRVLLAMPLVFQGKPMGVLCVASRDREFSGEHHTKLLARIADVLAIAVQNARLFAQVKQLARERGKLLEVSERERQRLEALVNLCPIGVLVADAASGRVTLLNREAQRMIGAHLLPGDLVETYEEGIVRLRSDGRPYAVDELPLRRALQRGERVLAEPMRVVFPDGHSIPTVVSAAPLHAADGRITGAVVMLQDVTLLEETERLRSEFLAMVSRELKTPLMSIKDAVATAAARGDVAFPEPMRTIQEQADRLLQTVDNLLEMSIIEAGALPLNRELTDLKAIFEDAMATFVRGSGSREVQLEVPDGLPGVIVDRRRILQVLSNLLSNAAKFSPSTSPIAVDVDFGDNEIGVHIRDRGRGVSRDMLPLMFTKFTQLNDDVGAGISGSGLGLAICRGIIEAHGGRIWAESPGEGQGTTVSFTLPVAADAFSKAAVDTSRRASHIGRVSRANELTRILIAGDDVQFVRHLQRHLGMRGYHAVGLGDRSQIVKAVELEDADLILLEHSVQGSSGFDLLTQVRSWSGVPVLFIGESSNSDEAVRALNVGADDYISRPFSIPELLARVGAILRRRLLVDTVGPVQPLTFDGLIIDIAARRVTVDGRDIALSPTEYKVLCELANHAGQVLTHAQILRRVWGPAYSAETTLLRSAIRHLRRKLRENPRHPRFILTERAVGYRMAEP